MLRLARSFEGFQPELCHRSCVAFQEDVNSYLVFLFFLLSVKHI